MKAHLSILAILLFGSLQAQIVNIPDANFKAALLADVLINTNMDTEIQLSEANTFNGSLYVSSLGITDLTGIEEFTSAVFLNCASNDLTTLNFTDTMALTNIAANYNDLTSIDLTYCPNLTQSTLRGNDLATIDLSQNTQLTYLVVLGNNLTSLDVSACQNLSFLDAGSNDIVSIDLSNNLSLSTLRIVANELTAIDLTPLVNLEFLNVTNNNLTSLDVSQNLLLEQLYSSFNDLGVLDLSNNIELFYLFALECNIQEIDISNNPLLEVLNLVRNNITAINLSNNLLLERFEISENPIIELDLSNHTMLTRVESYDCLDLIALDIANGNNVNFTSHSFTNCPMLSCITVDDVAYANTNFTNKDAATSYNADCGYCFISYSSNDAAVCNGDTYTNGNGITTNQAGIYYDTLMNTCGRDSLLRLDLSLLPLDTTTLNSEEYCLNDTVYFFNTLVTTPGVYMETLAGVNCDSVVLKEFVLADLNAVISLNGTTLEADTIFDAYQWFLNDAPIAGADTNFYETSQDGTYKLQVDLNNCSTFSNEIVILTEDTMDTGLGADLISSLNIKVYPNPASETLFVTMDKGFNAAIYDLNGREKLAFNGAINEIDLAPFEAGIYIIQIFTPEGIATTKLLVQ